MTKKSPTQRKQIKVQLERAKERRALAKKELEAFKKLSGRKLDPELYKPGPAFETRMMYQSDDVYWEAALEKDSISARMEEMKMEEYIEHLEAEVARLVGEAREK